MLKLEMRIPDAVRGFCERLLAHSADQLDELADAELMQGLPFIFRRAKEVERFQRHVANALGVPAAAPDVLIVGSAKTGFSLDPDRYFEPFRPTSDVDVVVVHAGLFDEAWRTMLDWDYATKQARDEHERRWLGERRMNVWSGWHDVSGWYLAERKGLKLSFPTVLKPLRDFSYRWFLVFSSLSRYQYHPEIPRHKVHARLYRTRMHVAMYHAVGLRALRAKLESTTE